MDGTVGYRGDDMVFCALLLCGDGLRLPPGDAARGRVVRTLRDNEFDRGLIAVFCVPWLLETDQVPLVVVPACNLWQDVTQ